MSEDERFVCERHGRYVVGSACSGHGFNSRPPWARSSPTRILRRAARSVVREQRPEELVERLLVAARDGGRGEGPNVRSSRDVHRQRDLAEVVARPQDPPRHRPEVRDREHPVEDDVEAVAGLALDDGASPPGTSSRRMRFASSLSSPREAPPAARSGKARPGWRTPRADGRSMRSARGSMGSSTRGPNETGSPSRAARRPPACSIVKRPATRSSHECGSQSVGDVGVKLALVELRARARDRKRRRRRRCWPRAPCGRRRADRRATKGSGWRSGPREPERPRRANASRRWR